MNDIPTNLPSNKTPNSMKIILFCQLTIGFGHSILLTLLPQIARKIGISDAYIGFIFVAFLFDYIAGLGIEKIILPMVSFFLLSITRILYAILASGVMSTATGYITDTLPKHH